MRVKHLVYPSNPNTNTLTHQGVREHVVLQHSAVLVQQVPQAVPHARDEGLQENHEVDPRDRAKKPPLRVVLRPDEVIPWGVGGHASVRDEKLDPAPSHRE